MKNIHKYESFEDVYEKIKDKKFEFLTFEEDLGRIEVLTVEENNNILAYAVLQKAENLNERMYNILCENLKYNIESEEYLIEILHEELEDPVCNDNETIDEVIEELNEELQETINKLEIFNKAIKMYELKDFYYISYVEAIPQNTGNGTILAEYIKNNYENTVLIASGYEDDKEKPREFWTKFGYINSDFSSMLIQRY